MKRLAVYLITKPLGIFDEEGNEISITVEVKLTQLSAQIYCDNHIGDKLTITKMMADKFVD